MPVVVRIKVEQSADRSHDHIVGVYTSDGQYRNNRQVVESIDAGERWYSTNGGDQEPIGWVRWCPGMNCGHTPYLVSKGSFQYHVGTGLHIRPVDKSPDRLENLPTTGAAPIGSSQEQGAASRERESQGQPA